MQPEQIHPLTSSTQPGLQELHGLLRELLGGRPVLGSLREEQPLPSPHARVFRLRFNNGSLSSVVIKRLEPAIAQRNELVARRWLPAAGLGELGPTLLGVAAARDGGCVWHVYEDLGDNALSAEHPNRKRVKAAVAAIARIHTSFAGHPLLPECRLHGGDFGFTFFATNLRDALNSLERLHPPRVELSAHHAALRERLLARLHRLREEQSQRAEILARLGGPETLLHGDLWTTNTFVVPAAHGFHARFIDWDHAGVGPISYDLSTFLLRFAPRYRTWILSLYREAVAEAGWKLPEARELNSLFETAEFARFANRIIWPAIAIAHDRTDWGYAALAEVEEWFEQHQPVLREDGSERRHGHGAVDAPTLHTPPPGHTGRREKHLGVLL